MARKTLIRPESNPPSGATVTSLPVPLAMAAKAELRRLHDGADRELFALRFAHEARRCRVADDELDARDRRAVRNGADEQPLRLAQMDRVCCMLKLSNYEGNLARFNYGLDERLETWEEHALDRCADLVKARKTLGLEPGPLRQAPSAPKPIVCSPVVARDATQEERAAASPIAVAALERMVAAAEIALADARAMLQMTRAVASGPAVPAKWNNALAKVERAVHCSECGDITAADDQMIDAIRTLSGHLVYITGGDFNGNDPELLPMRIEWARKMIEDHGAGNGVAARILSQNTA